MANGIDINLIQKTMNYLASCPYGQVKELVAEWEQSLKPEEIKKEPEPDAGDNKAQ